MPSTSRPLRVATYNLRFAQPDGAHRWTERRPVMIEQLRELALDVLATQEGLAGQLAELAHALGYHQLGQGRLGGTEGEHTAILYDPRKLTVLDAGDRWLSLQPRVPGSIHPAAKLPRMLTWARLASRLDATEIVIVNTHLSHVSALARAHGATMLLDLLNEVADDVPTVVLGDFNAPVGDELFDLLTGPTALRDAATVAQVAVGVHLGTYTGFDEPAPGERIDWLLVDDHLDVLRWEAVLPPPGLPPSDHLPVVADVSIREPAVPRAARTRTTR